MMPSICSAVRSSLVLSLLLIFVSCLVGRAVAAQDLAEVVKPAEKAVVPSLDSVRWSGKPVNFDMLRGKTVVMLVYATWCPICNEWSPDFLQQLKDSIEGKPVVVLAINADTSPQGVQAYLAQRDFFAPNVLHGYDPSMVAKLKLKNNLFNYAMIGPDGKMQGTGAGGSFFPEGDVKKYALPKKLAEGKELGSFELMQADLSAEIARLLWPIELGIANDAGLTRAKRQLSEQQREELKSVVDSHLDGQLTKIRELAEGEVTDKFEAVERATRLTVKFRSATQTREVRKLLLEMARDKQFKKEMAAKKYYDRQMLLAAKTPARRQTYLQAVAKRFEGTHYGDLAKEESEE